MLNTRTRLFFSAFRKDEDGAALRSRFRLSAPTDQKIGYGSEAALKTAAPAPQHWLTPYN